MALLMTVFICYTIYVELPFYVHVRNSYLVSPAHRLSEAANTILVTDIPEEDLPVLEDVWYISRWSPFCLDQSRSLGAVEEDSRAKNPRHHAGSGGDQPYIISNEVVPSTQEPRACTIEWGGYRKGETVVEALPEGERP